jgi:hypothetical protein
MKKEQLISYSHRDNPGGIRFIQLKSTELPRWAVRIQDYIEDASTTRKEGYYWVKHKGEWVINYWEHGVNRDGWIPSKSSTVPANWLDDVYDEIDENVIERE